MDDPKESFIHNSWRKLSLNHGNSGSSDEGDLYSWACCQQVIVKILHGEKVDADERTKVANSIRNLASESLGPLLIDFYKNQLLPPAMQDLYSDIEGSESDERKISKLLALWNQFYTCTVPNIQSILYPLEHSEMTFDLRRTNMVAFRDEIVMRTIALLHACGENLLQNNRTVSSMLVILEMCSRENSENFEKFQKLFHQCIDAFPAVRKVDGALSEDCQHIDHYSPTADANSIVPRPQPQSQTLSKIRMNNGSFPRRHSMIPVINEVS